MSTSSIEILLDVNPTLPSFTCVGTTQQGVRCGRKVNKANRTDADGILRQLNRLSLHDIRSHHLTSLATRVLCLRDHNEGRNDQRDYMVSVWRQKIGRAIQQPVSHSVESSRSLEPSTSWRPGEILTGDMGEDVFICVGKTVPGARCTNSIGLEKRNFVHGILRELEEMDCWSTLDDKLEELARGALCRNLHDLQRNQIFQIISIWKFEIEQYKERIAAIPQTASPIDYLPTPPQSRGATPTANTPTRSHARRSAGTTEPHHSTVSRIERYNNQLLTPPSSRDVTPEITPVSSVDAVVEQNDHSRTRPRSDAYHNRDTAIERSPTRSSHRRSVLPRSTSTPDSTSVTDLRLPEVPDTEPGQQRQPLLEQEPILEEQQPVLQAVSVTAAAASNVSFESNALSSTNTISPSETLATIDNPIPATSNRDTASDESVLGTTPNIETPLDQESLSPLPRVSTEPLSCANQDLHRSRRQRLPDSCFVCYEEMAQTDDLVWCKAQCGQNLHRQCWTEWTERALGNSGRRCPYCRSSWDFTACLCDDQPPLVDPPTSLVDIWTRLPSAAQANLLWGPLPPRPRLEYRSSS